LRVPNMKERARDEKGYPIDHASMRFRKTIEIPTFPRAGEALELSTRSGRTIPTTINRVDVDEARGLLVLSCQFSRGSISADDYAALSTDPDWELKHLLD